MTAASPKSFPQKPLVLPRRKQWLRSVILGLLLAGLAASAGVYYYYAFATVANAEVARVERGTALDGVYGTVNVEPEEEVVVRTRNYGQITALNIKAGDVVKKNQVIAVMEDDTYQRQIDSLQASLEQEKARQKMGPPSASALMNKEIEVDRLKKLVDANNIAPIEYQKAVNDLNSLRTQLQSEMLAQKNAVDSIQRQIDATTSQLGQLQIKAPQDGIVLKLFSNLGEFVPPQTQICRIGSAENATSSPRSMRRTSAICSPA